MEKIFLCTLNMSLTGAFVIAAIMLARLPLRKAPKRISYALWTVAGFRLVFPFSIQSVFSLLPFRAAPIPQDIAMQAVPRIDSGIAFVDNAVSAALPAATPMASVNPLQIWLAVGSSIWLVGIAVMLVYSFLSIVLLKRGLAGAVHIEGNLYEAGNLKTPFVIGLFKPKIYIPAELNGEEYRYIVLHEQTHIRRHDHAVKMFAYLVLCLHWFNPLAWIAFILMGTDMEMSCDERVMQELGGGLKTAYSLSLVRVAAGHKILNGSPLAFGEGGMKQRVKNVLHFKKHSRVIIIAAAVLAAALVVGFAVNGAAEDKRFPMQGLNVSDLQTDALLHHIAQVLGAKREQIIVPEDNFQLQVSGNFDWMESQTVSMLISKSETGGAFYAAQLRIFPGEHQFWVTKPQPQEPPQKYFYLGDYLDALKYLPQEQIRSLMRNNPDTYLINFAGNASPSDNQPCVFYDQSGVTGTNSGWSVRLDIQPGYRDADGSGYHGSGSDAIHVFYGGAAETDIASSDLTAQIRAQYRLEDPTEKQKLERLASVTLYDDGRVWLRTPPISSYFMPKCTFSISNDELLIHALIENNDEEGAFGVKNGDVIARFTIADEQTLVFLSATVPLFADAGARYVRTPPQGYEGLA